MPLMNSQRGKKIFVDKGCVACHAIEGEGAFGTIGPNLTGLASRNSLAAGILESVDRENLRRWLKNPAKVKPGNVMTNGVPGKQIEGASIYKTSNGDIGDIQLSEAELTDLIAYLLTLK